MNLKSLLVSVSLVAAVTASAEYPIYFRDTVNEGGHMTFPKNDDGTPAFNEDGSITLTRIEGDGVYFRTKKLGTTGLEPTEKAANTGYCDPSYTVLAFEYKSNMPIDNVVIFHHEGFGNYADVTNGAMLTVADDYQTCYAMMNRNATTWGYGEGYANNYNWISFNNTVPGWELTVKNLRLLTLEEAAAECTSSSATVVPDVFTPINFDFDMDTVNGVNIYVKSAEPARQNPVLGTGERLTPLPSGLTKLCFDYILWGSNYDAYFWVATPGLVTSANVVANLQANYSVDDFDPENVPTEWNTASVELGNLMADNNFASTFGSKHRIWFQSQKMTQGDILAIKNVRWEGALTGVANVEAAAPANGRTYNLMGVEVKGELAPGIYVRDGKKFIVK